MFRHSNRSLIVALAIVGSLTFACIEKANSQAATRVTDCSQTTPNNAICVTGTPPVAAEDGTPIAKPLTFRVDQRLGTSGNFAQVATGLSTLKYYAQNLAPGTYYFRVFVDCTPNCISSDASNIASRAATENPTKPNPAVIIIAATIRANGPPSYRIVYTVKPRDGEYVFVAPESMRPVFAAR